MQRGMSRDRDYKAERAAYYGYGPASSCTALQRKHRKQKASRNKARALMRRQTGRRLTGYDVDHVNGNPLDNRPGNLRVSSIASNRSKNRHKSRRNKFQPY